jgi:hypothetical protein
VVGADHGGVEIGEAVDLRAAEEADGDAPALPSPIESGSTVGLVASVPDS